METFIVEIGTGDFTTENPFMKKVLETREFNDYGIAVDFVTEQITDEKQFGRVLKDGEVVYNWYLPR